MTLCLGTYSGGLIGYVVKNFSKDDLQVNLGFAYSPHTGCVKSIRCRGALLLTGSTDETIRIFNLERRQEQGVISEHASSISSLDILGSGKMMYSLSAAEDGSLCLWRSSDWFKLAQLRGHSGPIVGIAFHPSGRTALTVSGGQERALRLWDLLRGTCAISQKFTDAPLGVTWNCSGLLYAVLFPKKILVRHPVCAHLEVSVVLPFDKPASLTTFAFLSPHHLVVGDTLGQLWGITFTLPENPEDVSNGSLTYSVAYTLSAGRRSGEQSASSPVQSRIKSVCVLRGQSADTPAPEEADTASLLWFASVTSNGMMSLWAVPREMWSSSSSSSSNLTSSAETSSSCLQPVKTISVGARVTAMDCSRSCDPVPLDTIKAFTAVNSAVLPATRARESRPTRPAVDVRLKKKADTSLSHTSSKSLDLRKVKKKPGEGECTASLVE